VSGGVELVGGDTFARTLRGFGNDLRALTDAHTAAGAAVIDAVQLRARRKSGALAGSFSADVADTGVQIGSPLIYAGVQEYGWSRRHITPSLALTSSLDDSTDRIETIYAVEIDGALQKVSGA
jgi:hypothetical protein